MSAVSSISSGISIHVLREEDDLRNALLLDGFVIISIHVLREEDDGIAAAAVARNGEFQSTSSARRTTNPYFAELYGVDISIHVLREEDDRGDHQRRQRCHPISIHVLREEDDCIATATPLYCKPFQSTSSARRTTSPSRKPLPYPHTFQSTSSARRTTVSAGIGGALLPNFNPRPPRGGRRGCAAAPVWICTFQSTSSARRTTCDPVVCYLDTTEFQSTSSARRTTEGVAREIAQARNNFNPRPPRGGRQRRICRLWTVILFQSTSSARRTTTPSRVSPSHHSYFNPRPPRGGRLQLPR